MLKAMPEKNLRSGMVLFHWLYLFVPHKLLVYEKQGNDESLRT